MVSRWVADLAVVLAVAGWWLTSRAFSPEIFPSPINVLMTFIYLPFEPGFAFNAAMSAARVVGAVIISVVLGTAIALLPRYFPWTRAIIEQVIVVVFNSVPGSIWAILGALWFGLTFQATMVVQVLIIIPFTLVNVAEGVRAIGLDELEMGRSFGRRAWSILWHIELPLLRPFIIAGARVAYGVCWKVSLIAELFGARSGLGYLMQDAQDFGRVDEIMAICFVIVAFVAVGEWVVWVPLARRQARGG
jgi:ABC-type nitrate/sulfonate/bicarbonate transport system permease component